MRNYQNGLLALLAAIAVIGLAYKDHLQNEMNILENLNNTEIVSKSEIKLQKYESIKSEEESKTTSELQIDIFVTPPDNGKVKIIITANEELQSVEGWALSNDKKSLSKIYEVSEKVSLSVIKEILISEIAKLDINFYEGISTNINEQNELSKGATSKSTVIETSLSYSSLASNLEEGKRTSSFTDSTIKDVYSPESWFLDTFVSMLKNEHDEHISYSNEILSYGHR